MLIPPPRRKGTNFCNPPAARLVIIIPSRHVPGRCRKRKPERLLQLDDPFSRVRLQRHDRNAKFLCQPHRIQPQTGPLGDIHHVQPDNHGQTHANGLQDKLQVAFKM